MTLQRVEIHVKYDPNGKYATIWGIVETTSTTSTESAIRIQTDLRPSASISIAPAGMVFGIDGNGRFNGNNGAGTLNISASGVITLRSINWADSTSNNKCRVWMFPVAVYL